jgi:hypothetical protein
VSAIAGLLGLWVRIMAGHRCLSSVCRVLSGRDHCVGLITRPEESYRVWCVQALRSPSPIRGGHDPKWVKAPQKKIVLLNCVSVPLFSLVRDVLEAAACYLRNVYGPDTRTVFVKIERTFHSGLS